MCYENKFEILFFFETILPSPNMQKLLTKRGKKNLRNTFLPLGFVLGELLLAAAAAAV